SGGVRWWCGEDSLALCTLALCPLHFFLFALLKRSEAERSNFLTSIVERFVVGLKRSLKKHSPEPLQY
ncbi:hypothetical protein, partial [Aetokthonos hydrillicola]|uniref:hypothetical protein n=1 Tax=Aetokthonos hydrillicola TaxID=1550245 RepID=UPI001ABBD3FF